MDAWSQDQLKKMQLGGNDKLNAFLKEYGIDKHTEIKDKYNSQAAGVRGGRVGIWRARGRACVHGTVSSRGIERQRARSVTA